MHIEFIDLLRCPNEHEDSWLVAALNGLDGRNVIEATLGCPVCRCEFAVKRGVAVFGDPIISSVVSIDATHVAAFLDLTSPHKTVLLAGAFAVLAPEISELTSARVVSLNASDPTSGDDVLEIRANAPLPLASASFDGIALDDNHSSDSVLAEAARLLKPAGRIMVPANRKLPDELRELARDRNHIVGERARDVVPLVRKT